MEATKPTVGRMVYYKTRGSADGVYPPQDRAAIVTTVNEDGTVNLCSFSDTGFRFELNVVQGQEVNQWDWMPFQKDQMARLAAGTQNDSHTATGPTGTA
jgi:hypothetical protein